MNTLLYVGMWEWAVNYEPQATAVELAQLGEGCRGQANVINLKRLLNGKQNVWKYQNGEEKSDSDGR
ncbi:MAG: hypothetical protein UFN18_08040, partial [Ruminococcus sp.]|nr:hypothetical protein [Ruminococcus sp.]